MYFMVQIFMQSLYNIYQPTSLDNVINQEFVIEILNNVIKKNMIPNAILLSGIHGVGKTLIAKLFAKKLAYDEDILEIDGVSYSGVENIRSLIEDIQYTPLKSKYKIYIIDEIHMLSRQAFDCLLLTLQSPPSHIKFIFATTNVNKIPETILSRCLILTLNKISIQAMHKYLHNISQDLKINIDSESLNVICKYARGSLRSALSMLNILYYYDQKITFDLISEKFKQISSTIAIEVFEYILQGKTQEALYLWRKYYELNYTEKSFFNEFIEIIASLSRFKYAEIESEYHYLFEKYYLSNALLLHYWDILSTQYIALTNNISSTVDIAIIMMSTVQITDQLNASISTAFPNAKIIG